MKTSHFTEARTAFILWQAEEVAGGLLIDLHVWNLKPTRNLDLAIYLVHHRMQVAQIEARTKFNRERKFVISKPLIRRAFIEIWLLASFAGSALAQTSQPTTDQLYTAMLTLADIRAAKVTGDWSANGPVFSVMDRSQDEPGYLSAVTHEFTGWPRKGTFSIYASLNLFAGAEDADKAFVSRLGEDIKYSGPVIPGPSVGDESRYHAKSVKNNEPGGTALRVRSGRYLVLIESGGSGKTLSVETLSMLGKQMIERLALLDAGKLQTAPLPRLSRALPTAADISMPILGTGALERQSWAWVAKNGNMTQSRKLRGMLIHGDGEKGVTRTFKFPDAPEHFVDASIMAFPNEELATMYLKATTLGFRNMKDGTAILFPSPKTIESRYILNFQQGRNVGEVSCYTFSDNKVVPACEVAVKNVAEKVRANLVAF
jgi:hypothetical protein